MPQALAVIGAVTSVAGTVVSYSASQKAAKANERQQNLATSRQNRSAIREAQIKRAQALNTAAQVGAGTGSGISGGVGSLSSQLGSGLGFSSQMSALSTQITKYQKQASLWGDIAGLGKLAYQQGGGMEGVKRGIQSLKSPMTPDRGDEGGRR